MIMKRFTSIAALLVLLGAACLSPAQYIADPPATNGATSATSGPAGAVTNTSLLNISVSPGPVYCQGDMAILSTTTFGLVANQVFNVYLDCSANRVKASTTFVGGPQILQLATVTCGATTCATITDLRAANMFPNTADGYYVVPPGACAWNQSGGTLVTNGLANVGASFLAVNQLATTTTTLTPTLTCAIDIPAKLTTLKGVTINDVTLLYGNSTGTLQTCSAPSISTIALPAVGAGETPSVVTPVAISGALTVTPVIGSCNVTALTAGALYTEKVALATPFNIVTDLQLLQFSQAFLGANGASETIYTAGLIVHYTYIPL